MLDIKMEDLMVRCEKCGGSGRPTIPAQGRSQYMAPLACEACQGRGQLLTPAGKVLIKFVREASGWVD